MAKNDINVTEGQSVVNTGQLLDSQVSNADLRAIIADKNTLLATYQERMSNLEKNERVTIIKKGNWGEETVVGSRNLDDVRQELRKEIEKELGEELIQLRAKSKVFADEKALLIKEHTYELEQQENSSSHEITLLETKITDLGIKYKDDLNKIKALYLKDAADSETKNQKLIEKLTNDLSVANTFIATELNKSVTELVNCNNSIGEICNKLNSIIGNSYNRSSLIKLLSKIGINILSKKLVNKLDNIYYKIHSVYNELPSFKNEFNNFATYKVLGHSAIRETYVGNDYSAPIRTRTVTVQC